VIDVHTHILPGLDDGAADRAESVEIARLAAADGVRVMVATPHIREDFDVPIGEIAGRVASLNGELDREGIPLRVVPGGEVAVTKLELLDDADLGKVSLGGDSRHLLVETPYGSVPSSFDEAVFRLALRGFTALIAHPERSATFQRRPERVARMVERGALVQVTASALSGGWDQGDEAYSWRLLEDGLVHVLASDVHHAGGSRASRRGSRAARRARARRARRVAHRRGAGAAAGRTPSGRAAGRSAPPPGARPPPPVAGRSEVVV
jgi:protein-tyrosine phosphatase